MFLRQVRWLAASLAAVAAVCLSPSWSRAGTQILVQELDSSGAPVGAQQLFSGTSATTSTAHFSLVQVTVNPSSLIGSMTTNVGAQTGASMAGTGYYQLRVIATSDGFTNPTPGGFVDVSNSAGASTALNGGNNVVTNQTQLFSGTVGGTLTPLGPQTAVATDVLPVPATPPTRITTNTVADLPGTYAIQQLVTVTPQPTGGGTIPSGSTFGDTAGSTVTASAVPAPGGLALALIGLPLIGLRRALRKRAAV